MTLTIKHTQWNKYMYIHLSGWNRTYEKWDLYCTKMVKIYGINSTYNYRTETVYLAYVQLLVLVGQKLILDL